MNNNRRSKNDNGAERFKTSGATYTKISKGLKEGYFHVAAWKLTPAGMVKASAFPVVDYNDKGEPLGVTEHVSQKTGNIFVRYKVSITQGIATQNYYCLMNKTTKKIVINELSMVISPNGKGKTSKGTRVSGYFGKNFQ